MNRVLAPLRPGPPGTAASPWLLPAQLATLALLFLHAADYLFLTDDAFISFRYARNLADGAGLTFNPGAPPVEGYTNFLWVLLLAAGRGLGAPIPVLAHVLTLAATAWLWWLVATAAARSAPPGRPWLALVPPLLLAVTRSVAVWSTGGLETRLFECLVLAGALRLVREKPGQAPLAALAFAGAALTRPDGILIAGLGIGAALLVRARRGGIDSRLVRDAALVTAVVGAHVLFRLFTYGDWVPNTFHAKVTGFRWETGWAHHAALVLEYGALLGAVPLAAGIVRAVRAGRGEWIAVAGAIVLGHAVYLAAVGGDHFEYRPQDLYFPFAFLVIGEGLAALPRGRRGAAGAIAGTGAVILGLTLLPRASHVQFPREYHAGFPGWATGTPSGRVYLHPDRTPGLGWPVVRSAAEAHRDLLRFLTRSFVGIRQEEHRLFLEQVLPEADRLRALVEAGRVPADAVFALDSVGALPYVTRLPTLDRLGLTDAHVARHGEPSPDRLMAHERRASFDYAREAGVDFWAFDSVHPLFRVDDPALPGLLDVVAEHGLPVFAGDAGDGWILLGLFPQGEERGRERFPRIEFRDLRDPAAREALRARGAR